MGKLRWLLALGSLSFFVFFALDCMAFDRSVFDLFEIREVQEIEEEEVEEVEETEEQADAPEVTTAAEETPVAAQSEVEPVTEPMTEPVTEAVVTTTERALQIEDLPEDKRPSLKDSIPLHKQLPMEAVLQNPELPTGCESVALTAALRCLGFSLGKTEIAENYLRYSPVGNFAEGFVGNPFSYEGAGVFPPGIVYTANDFFKEMHSSLRAYDATGLGIYRLLRYVGEDSPVLLWVTIGYGEPYWGGYGCSYGSRNYEWYYSEHCVALKGYNLLRGTVTLIDPMQGEVTKSLSFIRRLMEEIGNYAVVLR